MTVVVMSCYEDGAPPVSFKWTDILVTRFGERDYEITMVLHGGCLKYALRSSKYPGGTNPYKEMLKVLAKKYCVKIVVCHLCLVENGYKSEDVLPFVKEIPFSIEYIIQAQVEENAKVVYDA
ncbi:MAG: hypothetical protein Hyperionvirus14_25 [Hyperionvirus sp.]|uniref:Uncharacterized protein n=1 Tax=Hyperionvirus sp. TaxID=2487770 RepID=A0A3G5A9I7_9VIRU|nr:MAG: hypothetical protein Hyperionvirus14_25 [Hyperionvirus sp.]